MLLLLLLMLLEGGFLLDSADEGELVLIDAVNALSPLLSLSPKMRVSRARDTMNLSKCYGMCVREEERDGSKQLALEW